MNLNDILKELPILKSRKVTWIKPNLKDDIKFFPYPNYDQEVKDFIEKFYDLNLVDKNYLENHSLIKHKELEVLSIKELLTMLTFYIRGERFCDGLLASVLENGQLEKILKRIHELSK